MSKRLAQNDPALAIEFFISGFYTHRSQLFAPFKGIGVNVVSFHDPVIDGKNMEDTDLYEWQRRPGFAMFCSVNLADAEIVDDFYSFRNLNGSVISLFDSNARIATFTTDEIETIIAKTTEQQGYPNTVGNMMYFSDGTAADMLKWLSTTPFTSINPSTWGIPAPTLTPTIFSQGCWLPFTAEVVNNAILDPNGNVQVVTSTFGGNGVTGGNEPLWPTTTASVINDGSVQWTNMGPLLSWLPAQFYPVPVVVLDTNGNLELATATTPAVAAWNAITSYTVGTVVLFAGLYWAALVDNTNVPPSEQYVVTTGGVTQPYWVQTQSPSSTGTYSTSPFTPTWNPTVGGQTTDGNYIWTNLGPGVLVESFGTSYVYCYRTIYGHLSTASPISLNTGSIFGPQVATITSFSITGNIVTFIGANNFIPGSVFTVRGLSIGTYLNDQPFIAMGAGLSPTQFSAAFTFPDVGSTSDSGATVNRIASLTGRGTTSPLCNATATITASQIVAGVVTIYAVNDFVPGLQVTLTGLTVASFLNNLQFQIINVDPAGQWFQVYFTTDLGIVPPDQQQTTDTGTATFNAVEIYRTSDGGGIYLFCGAITNPAQSSAPPQSYDSGLITAGEGTDDGTPGTYAWVDPNNVTSPSLFATVAVPAPTMAGTGRFNVIQNCGQFVNRHEAGLPPVGEIESSFGSPVGAGNSILVFVTVHDDNVPDGFVLSDNQGNSYAKIAEHLVAFSNGANVGNWIYLANGVSAGSTQVKVAYGPPDAEGNAFFGFIAVECSGLVGTAETPSATDQTTGTSLTPGPITTATAHEVVLSFIWSDLGLSSAEAAAYPGGYSLFNSLVAFEPAASGTTNFKNHYLQMAAVYQVQTATGTFNPVWNTPGDLLGIGINVSLPLYTYNVSNGLDAQDFDFTVPPSIGVTGIQVEFNGSFNGTAGDGVIDAQLLQNGTPVGSIFSLSPQVSTSAPYSFGGPGNLWGFDWQPGDVNNAAWGVRFIATQRVGGIDAVFGISDVRVRITGSTSTGWNFNDFTTDDDLNILLIAPQNHQNDPPPGAPGSSINSPIGTITRYWQGRLFMVVGNYVYFDAGPDCTNGIPEESWPPANRFQFPGPVFALEPTADGVGLLVYLADRVAAILGGPETISFYATDALSNFGISNPNAIFRDGSIIGQFTTQRQYFEILGSQKEEIGEHIADYLTANFNPAQTYVTMHRDGLDVGMFLSNGVDQIARFGSNIGAWSVPAFPVMGAGALQSIETSVGVYSLMLAAPNGGVTSATPPTNPSVAASLSTGAGEIAWINPAAITLGNFSEFATLTLGASQTGQSLTASSFPFNIPLTAVILGVEVSVTGQQGVSGGTPLTITPLNAGVGAEADEFGLGVGGDIIDQFTTSTGSGTTITTPTLTPSAGVDLAVFATFSVEGTGTMVPDAGWITAEINDNPYPGGLFYQTVSAPIAGSATIGAPAPANQAALTLFGSNGSPAVVQSTQQQGGFSATFLSAVTPGNALIATVWVYGFTGNGIPGMVALSDSAGDIFTLISNVSSGVPNPVGQILTFICPVSAGGFRPVDYTFTSGTANGQTLAVLEVSGLSAAITPTTVTFGGAGDLWGMNSWLTPEFVNGPDFGFRIFSNNSENEFLVSGLQVKVTYQNPGNFLYARDLQSWGDGGQYGENNGSAYASCYITVGSITLTQLGAPLIAVQHFVGYFDPAGTLGEGGGPSIPSIWWLPNEVNAKSGIGFIQLPEAQPEPPIGQNLPSKSIIARRWPVNAANSELASQFVHHLQVKIQFEPESAPNTIKAIAFKEHQDD